MLDEAWQEANQRARLQIALQNSIPPYSFYGGNRALFEFTGPQAILAGPAETGKTLAALTKLHKAACTFPRASIVIARKQLTDTYSTVLRTFTEKVLPENAPISIYGGEKPQWFDYPNGSRIWVAGLDKQGKILSAEHDVIYVNQVEELNLSDWETLTTRTTGRAGNMPYSQTLGDCNPAGARHWIIQRSKEDAITLFKSTHRDNPTLFNPITGEITEQGEKTLDALGALTGHRRKRLLLGEWASPEGLVYERFSEDNVSNLAEYDPARGAVELAIDDGFANNPRVVLFIQVDDEGIINVFQESYHLKHLARECVEEAKEYVASINSRIEIAIVDPSAVELITELRRADIPARGASHPVTEGIKVVERFIWDGGRTRMRIHPRCKNFIFEMGEGYRYPNAEATGANVKPVKEDDHGPDAIRYWIWLRMRRR